MVTRLVRLLLLATTILAVRFIISPRVTVLITLLFTKIVEGSPFGNLYNVSKVPLSCPSEPMFFLFRIW